MTKSFVWLMIDIRWSIVSGLQQKPHRHFSESSQCKSTYGPVAVEVLYTYTRHTYCGSVRSLIWPAATRTTTIPIRQNPTYPVHRSVERAATGTGDNVPTGRTLLRELSSWSSGTCNLFRRWLSGYRRFNFSFLNEHQLPMTLPRWTHQFASDHCWTTPPLLTGNVTAACRVKMSFFTSEMLLWNQFRFGYLYFIHVHVQCTWNLKFKSY